MKYNYMENMIADIKDYLEENKEYLEGKTEEELRNYSYKVIDLLELQRDLEDIRSYFLNKKEYVGNVCETIDKINKEVNNEI